METTYRLNTRDLGNSFINSLREAYPDKDVEIMVREQPEQDSADTEYLLSSPANRKHLEKAMENSKQRKNIIFFENVNQAMQAAAEMAAKK